MSPRVAPLPNTVSSWTGLVTRWLPRQIQTAWGDAAAAIAAVAGIVLAMVPGFHVRTFDAAGSDFKTLFASAYCFVRGIDAYSSHSIARIFHQQHIVSPPSWFAHSAVYPPPTLLLIAPFTLLPMDVAVWAWMIVCSCLFAWAVYTLARVAREWFRLGFGWRLAIIGIAAALPLFSFGLFVGNVSAAVGSLCILAVAAQDRSAWSRVILLAAAALLKPHIALWVLLAFLFNRDADDRRTALRTIVVCGAFASLIAVWAALDPHVLAQFASYHTVLHNELSSGSMNADSLRAEMPAAQITAFSALLGYWLPVGALLTGLNLSLLLVLGALLLMATRYASSSRPEMRLLLAGAWLAFGLIATYHRSHDATALLVLLPWIAWRIRQQPRAIAPWLLLLGFAVLSIGLTDDAANWLHDNDWSRPMADLLLYRQSGLAALALALLVTLALLRAVLAMRSHADRDAVERQHVLPGAVAAASERAAA